MEIYDDANKIELRVYDVLKRVIDPEVDINIIDLGLVYDIKYEKEKGICITMTFSNEGCPMGDVIINDISNILNSELPELKHKVDITWTPKWSSDFIKPNGRALLGLI